MTKHLAVFDFDHTIVDDNTDTAVIGLLDKSMIPESVTQLHRRDGWTAYMQAIFDLLHRHNIGESKILNVIVNIKCVEGFYELIKQLRDKLLFDIIIISDSNSYFINSWLSKHGLSDYILKVFTNPAQFENDLLKIEMYHHQNYCNLSTKNLCKGQIMMDFINQQKSDGIEYRRIIYAGDGYNDFCPILKLGENDLACVREKYKCADVVKDALTGKFCDELGTPYKVRAKICVWRTGMDILKAIHGML